MNKMNLIVVLLVLCIFTSSYATENALVYPEDCRKALSSSYRDVFNAIGSENLESLLSSPSSLEHVRNDEDRKFFLYYAALLGNSTSIDTLVSDIGIDVNTKDRDGWTALHYAFFNPDDASRENAIHTLIQQGASTERLNGALRDYIDYVQSSSFRRAIRSIAFLGRRTNASQKMRKRALIAMAIEIGSISSPREIRITDIDTAIMKIQDALKTKLSSYYNFLRRMDVVGHYIYQVGDVTRAANDIGISDLLLDRWFGEWENAVNNQRNFSKENILYLHNIRGITSNFVRNVEIRDTNKDDESEVLGIDDIPPLPADH